MEITPRGFERAADKLTQEQLDKPVDEVVAEAPAESVPETPVETEKEKVEEEAESPKETTPEPEPEPEEEKVPKSRFLSVHKRAIEAEKALRQFESERQNEPAPKQPVGDDAELKSFYIKAFGDTPLSEELYQIERARLATMEERATDRAFERMTEREQVEAHAIDQRVESMDLAFEELSVVTGKELTDDEQVAILDIVEKYSPKDKNGKIPEEYLLPLDQAYEIYQLHAETPKPDRKERNAVAALSGTRSQGTPSPSVDSDWQPGFQGRWRDKLAK